MILGLVALFFAGLFLANGTPHFVKGVTGQRHMTPFAQSSSAVVNVLWAAANFVAGGLLLWVGLRQELAGVLQAGVAGIGAFLVSVYLARYWSNPEAGRRWRRR